MFVVEVHSIYALYKTHNNHIITCSLDRGKPTGHRGHSERRWGSDPGRIGRDRSQQTGRGYQSGPDKYPQQPDTNPSEQCWSFYYMSH